MRVTLLLADSAQAINGKLYILGGGWSVTGPGPIPFSIAVKIEIPWDQANQRHKLRLQLFDSDGQPITLAQQPNKAAKPIAVNASFEVGRPAGTVPGTPIDKVFAMSFPTGLQLAAGSRFEWRLWINDESKDDWRLAFHTRAATPKSRS